MVYQCFDFLQIKMDISVWRVVVFTEFRVDALGMHQQLLREFPAKLKAVKSTLLVFLLPLVALEFWRERRELYLLTEGLYVFPVTITDLRDASLRVSHSLLTPSTSTFPCCSPDANVSFLYCAELSAPSSLQWPNLHVPDLLHCQPSPSQGGQHCPSECATYKP